MKKFVIVLAGVSALALSGCVSQEQADQKMFTGCEAAINAMIAPAATKDIKSRKGEDEKMLSSTFRRIKITYTEAGDFAESEKEGSCLFSQQWGMFKSSHTALLEQVNYNGMLLGKNAEGTIEGSMDDFLKLNEKVDAAMAQ